jgi:ABC-type polar amino acid transport system ATPase subunit
VRPTSGEIVIHGQERTKLGYPNLLRREIGTIFQEFNLVIRLSAISNVRGRGALVMGRPTRRTRLETAAAYLALLLRS